MMHIIRFAIFAGLSSVALLKPATGGEVRIEKTENGATVKIDGQLFTEYLIKSGNKPVLWPLIGPSGKKVARGFPIAPEPGETNDHVWHRGLWFTHGDVNGVMFWTDTAGTGQQVHRE